MRYTTYPLKESAELIAGCQKLDSKAPWATIRSLGFVLLSQDEKKIVSACEFCRRSSTDKNVHYSCSYKKADIVFKNGKKLTGVVVSVDGEGVKGPNGEEYTFYGDRVKGFITK
jgi:hypothetical protein